MTKRLVICLDGTWNNADDHQRSTNVVRIMRAIRHADDAGTRQITFYDKGVGTGGPLDRIRGGAFGRGLGENVRDGYRFLANNYEPRDEIYIFGFSRGAFTARSLAGFIGACGLLSKRSMGRISDAWNHYRTPPRERDPAALSDMPAEDRRTAQIRCVGGWDTVGALGIPVRGLNRLRRSEFEFHDAELGGNVDVALHAVSIDEKRGPFAPTLWTRKPAESDQTVEQVWFPGVHSDVGGGYPAKDLSDLALDWMIKRVDALTDLAFDAPRIGDDVAGDALGIMHESRNGLFRINRLSPKHRIVGGIRDWPRGILDRIVDTKIPGAAVNESIHHSAIDRFGRSATVDDGKSKSDQIYQPANLAAAKAGLPVVDADGEIVSVPGAL